jgi:hypothetical protein
VISVLEMVWRTKRRFLMAEEEDEEVVVVAHELWETLIR